MPSHLRVVLLCRHRGRVGEGAVEVDVAVLAQASHLGVEQL